MMSGPTCRTSTEKRRSKNQRGWLFYGSVLCGLLTLHQLRFAPTISSGNESATSEKIIAEQNDWIDTNLKLAVSSGNESATSEKTIAEQNEWIDTKFKAADPHEQDWCVKVLREGTSGRHSKRKGAQFGQDVFMARNLFLDAAMKGEQRGFYVEAGANDYTFLSTTYFFDKCLGWDGLCVEPQKQYHENLRKYRSCKLVPKCLSKDVTVMMIGGHRNGPGMFVRPLPPNATELPPGWSRIDCAPLHTILKDEVPGGRHHVDLFVLDVEGGESIVLETIDWTKSDFGALLIEDGKLPSLRKLDYDMNMRGYSKFHQLAIDTLYVKRSSVAALREKLWYPLTWSSFERHFPK